MSDGTAMSFLYPRVPARRRSRSRFRSCCTSCGATSRRKCRSRAVRLLHRSPIERSKRRRLRDLLLLAGASRRAAAAGRGVRAAVPRRRGPGRVPCVIVAIDRSFSMGAPGVFDRARQLAATAMENAGAARVALVAFDERADVIAPPGSAADARARAGSGDRRVWRHAIRPGHRSRGRSRRGRLRATRRRSPTSSARAGKTSARPSFRLA